MKLIILLLFLSSCFDAYYIQIDRNEFATVNWIKKMRHPIHCKKTCIEVDGLYCYRLTSADDSVFFTSVITYRLPPIIKCDQVKLLTNEKLHK